jgi:uncharacterized protein YlxP (DUF503 family)
MPIVNITIELEIPAAHSLKERRRTVRSMKDKLRHSFNVSVAEMDEGLVWNRATVGVVAISGSADYLRGQSEEIERAVYGYANNLGAVVTEIYADILA